MEQREEERILVHAVCAAKNSKEFSRKTTLFLAFVLPTCHVLKPNLANSRRTWEGHHGGFFLAHPAGKSVHADTRFIFFRCTLSTLLETETAAGEKRRRRRRKRVFPWNSPSSFYLEWRYIPDESLSPFSVSGGGGGGGGGGGVGGVGGGGGGGGEGLKNSSCGLRGKVRVA